MGGEGSVGGSGRWKRKRKGVRDGREGGENKIFLCVYTCMEDESKVFRCGTTSQEGTLNTFHISLL